MLFRHGEACGRHGAFDHAGAIEIDLPVILVVAIGTNGKHRAGERKGENFNVGSRICMTLGIVFSASFSIDMAT